MQESQHALVRQIMTLPILKAEWVLWVLIAMSILSLGIMLERALFLLRHREDVADLEHRIAALLAHGRWEDAGALFSGLKSLEAQVLGRAFAVAHRGPDAVEEVVRSMLSRQRQRFERSLTLLAVIGSNAPFVGLFGTVLGIIDAFASLSSISAETSRAVMGGVSEALIATAVGLLVAIPAVAAFQGFKSRIRARVEGADQLVRLLLAELKADPASLSNRSAAAA
jgi:biopolymer transport protein ExbB